MYGIHKYNYCTGAVRGKATTHPSNLCFVCMVCLDGINEQVLSSNYCEDPSHRKVQCVGGGGVCICIIIVVSFHD